MRRHPGACARVRPLLWRAIGIVFLSHASADADFIRLLRAALLADGYLTWMAPDDIHPGELWADAIERGISTSDLVLVAVTASSNASTQVAKEVDSADRHGKTIVPVIVDGPPPTGGLAYHLNSLQWIDVRSAPDGASRADIVVARVSDMSAKPRTSPAPPRPPAPRSEARRDDFIAPDNW